MKHLPILVSMVLLLTACHKDTPEPTPQPQPQPVGAIYITDSVRYETEHMTAYNYVYPSTDPDGQPVTLSATITMGDSIKQAKSAMGLILYNHFSVYRADQCPSRGELSIQKSLARSPLITVSPDHYGFGATESKHQAYCISSVNAQASVDALLAAEVLLADMGYTWSDNLFNVGYSQGGQTAMGVTRLVAQSYPDISFTCTLAGAGPYDIASTYRLMMQDSVGGYPSNIISVLLSYNEFAHLDIAHDAMFLEPVLSHIDAWFFSKQYTRQEIDALVGTFLVADYLTPALIDLNSDLSQQLSQAFDADNLCQGWTPRSNEPIYLFHNTQDNIVSPANTVNLYNHLMASGATHVTLDTAAYGTFPVLNGHDTGALIFIVNTTNVLAEMLGIEPWNMF
ncbi:MAG: hypothetical protein IKN29_05520 [Bacteroidales bacterium]|nr:hypothetical protein [Bacteroidales bacterium]